MPDILASDINGIRTKVVNILGNGAGSKGYGQLIYSSSVTAGQIIEKTQWDALRFDIYNCILHQTGNESPPLTDIPLDAVITDDAGDALQNYDYYADVITNNRFDVAVGQFGAFPKATETTSSNWSTSATTELTVTFASADDARYFFNSGGKIRITTDFTPGASPTQQSNAWAGLLQELITDFSARPENPINYYTLTDSYQQYFQRSSSTPYSANFYRLQAKVNVADNSLGTATVLTIGIDLYDNYVDPGNPPLPGDLVEGDLDIAVTEIKGTTVIAPGGTTWDITSPSYSLASIALT